MWLYRPNMVMNSVKKEVIISRPDVYVIRVPPVNPGHICFKGIVRKYEYAKVSQTPKRRCSLYFRRGLVLQTT